MAERWSAPASGELLCDPDYPGLDQEITGQVVRKVRRRDQLDPLTLTGGRIYQRFRALCREAPPIATIPIYVIYITHTYIYIYIYIYIILILYI